MSKFGRTLFGGGGFIRWALSPFVLLFAVVMPLVIDEWTFVRALVIGVVESMCLCLLVGFWLPPRVGFVAFRILAGLVFFSYGAYLVDEFFFRRGPFFGTHSGGDASPVNALLGFLVIGVPSFLFAARGRFPANPPPEPAANDDKATDDFH